VKASEPRKFTVPRGDGEVFAFPGFDGAGAQIAENRRRARAWPDHVGDLPLSALRRSLRSTVLALARQYTAGIVEVPSEGDAEGPLVVTGHQAELFHPGVWVKNAWAYRIARAVDGVSINLVVDNDVARHTALVVPRRWREAGRIGAEAVPIAFAPPAPARTTEETPVEMAAIDAFTRRVKELVRATPMQAPFEMFAERFTAAVREGATTVPEVLTATRRRIERDLGVENLELPVSLLAETDEFARFAADLIANARRFAPCYNRALQAYRKARHIRNRANPLPDLALGASRVEVPLWTWRRGGARQRLFLSEGALVSEDGELRADGPDPRGAMQRAAAAGYKIRPRALTMTMFVRLLLADTFIHGIGGANYDQVTDAIIAEYFGIQPPAIMTLSATLRLPLERPRVAAEDRVRVLRRLRDLRYQPERFVSAKAGGEEPVRELLREKRRLMESQAARAPGGPERFERFRAVNARLGEMSSTTREALEKELDEVVSAMAVDKTLSDREYGYPLHPLENIRALFGLGP